MIKRLFVCLIGLVILSEVALRFVIDFPLYDVDNKLGYWLVPKQAGKYLLVNDWYFNSLSMGVEREFRPGTDKLDVLLVGDSIVLGGNPLPQRDKLGPILERLTGARVWPVSAGSWGLQNELEYVCRHPETLAGADLVIFISNSGDFGAPSSWQSPISHPRSYPRSYIVYVIEKILNNSPPSTPPALKVPQRDVFADWKKLVIEAHVPVLAVAYQSQAERAANDRCAWVPKEYLRFGGWFCFQRGAPPRVEDYRDGLHPTRRGNEVLASYLARLVRAFGREALVAPRAPSAKPASRDGIGVRRS